MSESFWVIPKEDDLQTTDSIFQIIKEQAQYLKVVSDNKVFASFTRVKNTLAAIKKAMSAVSGSYEDDETIRNLSDANELYKEVNYGFCIYNSVYKFRVFELLITPYYPIFMTVDDGLVEDFNLQYTDLRQDTVDNRFVIESEKDFIVAFRTALSSKKVRYIIQRLMETTSPKSESDGK